MLPKEENFCLLEVWSRKPVTLGKAWRAAVNIAHWRSRCMSRRCQEISQDIYPSDVQSPLFKADTAKAAARLHGGSRWCLQSTVDIATAPKCLCFMAEQSAMEGALLHGHTCSGSSGPAHRPCCYTDPRRWLPVWPSPAGKWLWSHHRRSSPQHSQHFPAAWC